MKKIIKSVLIIGGVVTAGIYGYRKVEKMILEKEKKVLKFKDYYKMTSKWLEIKNQDKNLSDYFKDNEWKNIAIYGMGELGKRLCEELAESSININYVIDKEAYSKYSDIKTVSMEEELELVDVIVVTPIFDYESIRVSLEEKTNSKIISLEDVIYHFI